MVEAGIPVSLSCTVLEHIRSAQLSTVAGFAHIPDVLSPSAPVSFAQAVHAAGLTVCESLQPVPDLAAAVGDLR